VTWRPNTTLRPWDETFERWVRLAREEGVDDPNDIGDREWNDPLPHLQKFYFPHIRRDSVVLELGPGSGRITRHLIGRCREIFLIDYSPAACEWLKSYLAGKGAFRVHAIDVPAWPMISESSVDFACAFGVFEHIDLDDMRWYLEEIRRVLVSGGMAVFNFDNLMSAEGIDWHKRWRGQPGDRNIFRFYHPEMVCRLAEASGLSVADLRTSDSRHAEIQLRRPKTQ
jgi:cyclopropane fatty-acyl-phospholipid synthase-like methyltransferase